MAIFTDNTLNGTLYVPYGTKAAYEQARGWQAFKNIVEFDPTAVESVLNAGGRVVVSVHDLSGRKLDAPSKGVNIVRYNDGTTRKIIVR